MAVKTIAAPEAPELDPERQVTLDEVVGHREARDFLRARLRGGVLPQTLLITGPEGVGKHTLAWALAREIVAEGEDAATHRGSGKVARGSHPDIIVVGAKGASGQIVIDSVHELEDKVARSPLEAPKKIAIISPADRLNESSANSLLKLLEEPPPHLQLILIASDASNLMETIRSRCAIVPLEAAPLDELIPWLMKRARAGEDRARLAGEIAEGRPGLALHLLAGGGLERRKMILDQLAAVKTNGFAAIFGAADKLVSGEGANLAATLGSMMMLMRDALAISLGAGRPLNSDLDAELRRWAAGLTPGGILDAAAQVETAAAGATNLYSAASRLHFAELLMINIGRALREK